MKITLVMAAVTFIAWVVLAWFVPVGVPAVHLLLAASATLVVYGVGRWA
jgi:hypothetical protein